MACRCSGPAWSSLSWSPRHSLTGEKAVHAYPFLRTTTNLPLSSPSLPPLPPLPSLSTTHPTLPDDREGHRRATSGKGSTGEHAGTHHFTGRPAVHTREVDRQAETATTARHNCSIIMPGSPTSSHLHHFHHCPPLPTPHHWTTTKATEEPQAARGALVSMQGCHVTLPDNQKCAQERWTPTDCYNHHARFTNIHPTPP